MGSKTKENPRTMLYSSFFLHSTASLYPVREVIFQLKLLGNFCWLLSTYLEKDVVYNCQLSIYLIKQIKMILLSCSLVQLLLHFIHWHATHFPPNIWFSLDWQLSLFSTLFRLCFQGLFPNAAAHKTVVFLFFSIWLLVMQYQVFLCSSFCSGSKTYITCLSCLPHLCNY